MAGAKWTKDEDAIVRSLYPKAHWIELRDRLIGRSHEAIKARARTLRITRPRHYSNYWKERISAGRQAMWSDPDHRERMADLMRERVSTDAFKAHCGQLTASERAQVVQSIKSGRKYMDIALDWLISESRVQEIASEDGLYKYKSPPKS